LAAKAHGKSIETTVRHFYKKEKKKKKTGQNKAYTARWAMRPPCVYAGRYATLKINKL